MEEPQKTPEPKREDDQAAPARSAAKVIRAGVEAKAGQNPLRGGSGDGRDQGTVSAPAAAAAVPILRAGPQTLEAAEAAGQQVMEGAEDAARAAESADGGAGGQVLREWVTCAQRAYIRNTRALAELLYCRTPSGFLQWQSNLLSETTADLSATNSRILQLVSHKA